MGDSLFFLLFFICFFLVLLFLCFLVLALFALLLRLFLLPFLLLPLFLVFLAFSKIFNVLPADFDPLEVVVHVLDHPDFLFAAHLRLHCFNELFSTWVLSCIENKFQTQTIDSCSGVPPLEKDYDLILSEMLLLLKNLQDELG